MTDAEIIAYLKRCCVRRDIVAAVQERFDESKRLQAVVERLRESRSLPVLGRVSEDGTIEWNQRQ